MAGQATPPIEIEEQHLRALLGSSEDLPGLEFSEALKEFADEAKADEAQEIRRGRRRAYRGGRLA